MIRRWLTVPLVAFGIISGGISSWLGTVPVNAVESSLSRFETFSLRYGITIKLPKHWQILESQLMKQIDTNTEVLTGVGQGDNDIVIASNYYDGRIKRSAASARVSVRIKETLPQAFVEAMSQGDLDKMGRDSYEAAMSAQLKSGDSSVRITPYTVTKDKVDGYLAIRSDYQEIGPEGTQNVSIFLVCLGDRNVKLTLSYDSSQASILRPTINEIRHSFQFSNNVKNVPFQSSQPARPPNQAADDSREVITSKEHRFSWAIPHHWEKAKPLTAAQYAVQMAGSRGAFNCSLLVSPKKFELANLLKEPRVYFDNAVLPRFPGSTFLRSSTTKLGSQDALLTEYIYVVKTPEVNASFSAMTLCTVWKDHFYIMTFECSPKDAEFGLGAFEYLILGFSFL